MRYYTIQNNSILIAENRQALERYYSNVLPLPEDYEEGKYIVVNNELVLNPDWKEEKARKERERLNKLSLTKREVFLALYNDKGITPEAIKEYIKDPESLIEFEYANDYFRGNPLIDAIGQTLGYSSEQLDYLFEHKEFPEKEEPSSEPTEEPTEKINENTTDNNI